MSRRTLSLSAGLALLVGVAACLGLSPRRVEGASRPHVIGFVVPWDSLSKLSLQRHHGSLTEVAMPAFAVGDGGAVVDQTDPDLLRAALDTHLPVLGMVSNFRKQFDPRLAHQVCDTPEHRARFADALVQAAQARGFGGINLDLENLDPADGPGYAALARELQARCRPARLSLSVAVPVHRVREQNRGLDLKGLGEACDLVIAMIYDEHAPETEPGPIAGRDWSAECLRAVLAAVPANKLVSGVGTYGYDWSTGPAPEVSFPRALSLAASAGKAVAWDPRQRAPHFAYYDGKRRHEVWFSDAGTASAPLHDATSHRCAGVALWRLGDEDPELWRMVDGYRDGRQEGVRNSAVPMAPITTIHGEGDLFSIRRGNSSVTRTSEWRDGEVFSESYSPLHPAFAVERYLPVRRKLVALTFDDGPDPDNTPRLLEELRQAHAPATFFVIGQNVAAHPELLRREYAEGHDIGSHTYTHPHMEQISPLQARLEVNLNQRMIESVIGHRTVFFRRPYDVNNSPTEPDQIQPLLAAADAGHLLCGASIDPADWSGTPARRIVEQCLDELDHYPDGGVIVMHDGGGDRTQTLKAVPLLIDELRHRGYQLASLHQLIGRPRDLVMAPAGAEPALARAGLGVVGTLVQVGSLGQALLLTGLAFLVIRLILTTSGALIQYRRARRLQAPKAMAADGPLVSVIVPAYNEAKVIGRTIESLLASSYTNLEIIVVDDGSKDDTYESALAATTDPRVRVLRKENGGKGQALNLGIHEARGEWLVAIDADTLFERDTILYLLDRLQEPGVGAVAGNIKVGNRRSLLTRWQHIEYVVGINLDKRFFDLLGCVPVVPGAVGAWRKDAVLAAGGYSRATMAEDADLTLSVQRLGYRVLYEDRARAWTEAPESVECLVKQRLRWTFGTLQCLWKHRAAFFNPKAGTLGMIALPYIAFYHFLLLAGPLVDGALVLGCLAGWWKTMLLLSLPYLGAEVGMAATAFRMDGEPVRTVWPILLQRFGYRQLIYATMFRAVWMACKGAYLPWQKPRRLAALRLSVTGGAKSGKL